jgi:hypothetical protein
MGLRFPSQRRTIQQTFALELIEMIQRIDWGEVDDIERISIIKI